MSKIVNNANKSIYCVTIVILSLGIIIRFLAALKFPFWLDEATYFFISKNRIIDILFSNHTNVTQPPLYTLILHYWQQINTSEIFLRLPSLLFSAITLIFSYFIGKSIIDSFFGFLLLVIFSFSNFLITLSWQANVYALVIMFTVISIYLYFFRLRGKFSLILILAVNLLGFLSDYSFFWLIFCFFILELIIYSIDYRNRNYFTDRIFKIKAIIFTYFFILLWAILVINRIPEALSSSAWLTFDNMVSNTLKAFAGISKKFDIKVILYLILAVFGLITGLKIRNRNKKYFFLFSIISVFLPFTVIFVFSFLIQPIMIGRHLHLVAISLLIGLAYLTYYFRNVYSLIFMCLFIFLSVSGLPDLARMDTFTFDWRVAGKFIHDEMILDQHTTNIFINIENKQYFFFPLSYYLSRYNEITEKKFYVPEYVNDYFTHNKKLDIGERSSLWLFIDTDQYQKLFKFQKNLGCDKNRNYQIEHYRFLNCVYIVSS